jgi:tetraacyldisaccharide 4'-kinase
VKQIEEYWYKSAAETPWWLKPFSYLFRAIAWVRRLSYKLIFFRVYRARVPVIVVGNINVGGSGKTPFVIWLARLLKQAGYNPGIVSRGYGGKATHWPQQVRPDSDASIVGDEAVLIARHTGCPMAVGPSRRATVKQLYKHKKVDVIISDDGLQHYALGRDIEIAVIDGERRFGNGYCLPAGPLREPVSRLSKVNFVICNGGEAQTNEHAMRLQLGKAVNLADPAKNRPLQSFVGKPVHAVAGIGNPQRFFTQLEQMHIKVSPHAFKDHHAFQAGDFVFGDANDVLMTEKDAVKCERFAQPWFWYATVEAELDPALGQKILALVEKKAAARKHRWIANYSTS